MTLSIKFIFKDDGSVGWESVAPTYPPEQVAPFLKTGVFTAVTRTNDMRPLSHQDDLRFTLNAGLSDDFTTFNAAKWYSLPTNPWHSGQPLGRPPARYMNNNIFVEGGELVVRMRQVNPAQTDITADDWDPASTMDQPTPYGGYTSGQCISQSFAHYGYFEIKAKIMKSAGSSAFWLAYPALTDPQTEIDVFEMGGKGHTPVEGTFVSSNNRYNMDYHFFESPASPGREGYNRNATWTAPFDFADDYHVYGLDWQADFIRWYVDGVLIRVEANLDHKYPMKIILDSEAFWGGTTDGGWFGYPVNSDLPSTFRIVYLRVWDKA